MIFIAIVHVLIALALILFVLLQDPKGGAMGAFGTGGGSSSTFFGATGASNFLTTLTKWLAVMFAVSCISIVYMLSHRGGSVLDDYIPAPANEQPVDSTGGFGAPADSSEDAD